MSGETRARAIEKLDNMRVRAVYPDRLDDWSALDLPGKEDNGTLLAATKASKDFKISLDAAKIDQPVDKDAWDRISRPAYTVNASYFPSNNSINIFAGFLNGDVYSSDMSYEQKLGGIGAVIGHEISHAFDTNGAQYDKDGSVVNWWTDEDMKAFMDRAAKLAAWYDGFIPYEGCQYSGQRVQTEVIADMAGLKCVLGIAAQKENFDYEAFFHQYAVMYRRKMPPNILVQTVAIDVHPLSYLRINANLAQFDDFINFYGIRPGDGMYIAPEDRVAVW
jgi:putative endopeptidase